MVVVDPHRRFRYLIQKDNKAIRYGVGVGREGLALAGKGVVQEKKQWPHWTPTSAMIAREPRRYAKWARGVEGGVGNPLGARALYLFKNGKDTRYRIHGTTEPDSIGKAVSSDCIRMMNQDMINLYCARAARRINGRSIAALEAGLGRGVYRLRACDYETVDGASRRATHEQSRRRDSLLQGRSRPD
jgi:hypothetical protein